MSGTVLPPAEASRIIARRQRTVLIVPRRTIRYRSARPLQSALPEE
jgi:hypothetical protein